MCRVMGGEVVERTNRSILEFKSGLADNWMTIEQIQWRSVKCVGVL